MDMTMIGAWNVKGVQKGCFSHEGPKANLVRVAKVEVQSNSSSSPPILSIILKGQATFLHYFRLPKL